MNEARRLFSEIGDINTLNPREYRKLIRAIVEAWRGMEHSLKGFLTIEEFFNKEGWVVSSEIIKKAVGEMKRETVRINVPEIKKCIDVWFFNQNDGVLLTDQGDIIIWKATHNKGILSSLELRIPTNTEVECFLDGHKDSGKNILENLKKLFVPMNKEESDDLHRRERKQRANIVV